MRCERFLRAMLKNREGHRSNDAVKRDMDSVVKNLRCASLRCALQRCGALSSRIKRSMRAGLPKNEGLNIANTAYAIAKLRFRHGKFCKSVAQQVRDRAEELLVSRAAINRPDLPQNPRNPATLKTITSLTFKESRLLFSIFPKR